MRPGIVPSCHIVGGFNTFRGRSAFADIAKAMGVSEYQVRRMTERIPWTDASHVEEAVAYSQECRDGTFEEDPYRTALRLAHRLDGFPRYPKMHPCGVVLSRLPVTHLSPVFTSAKGYPATHFDMEQVEAIGLVKIDILAQAGLAVMRTRRNAAQARRHRGFEGARTVGGQRGVEDDRLGQCPWRASH
jgi:DNA polymerase-3 subunit alpha